MPFRFSLSRPVMVVPVEHTRPSDWWHHDKGQLIVPQSVYPIRPKYDRADSIAFQPSNGSSAGVALSELLDYNRGLKEPNKFLMVDTSDSRSIKLYIHWPGEPDGCTREILIYEDHGRRRLAINIACDVAKAYQDLFLELRNKFYPSNTYGADWKFAQDIDRLRLNRIFTRDGVIWYAEVAVVLDY